MSEAGIRTLTTESSSSIPHRRDRIDLTITVNLSRLAPPDINLMAFSHDHGTASLTEYPLMHLMQSRDLDLEVDEIKKAVQHEVWSLFQVWHPRSTFHLTVEVRTPEHSRSIAQQLAYDTTIDEVLQLLPPRRSCLHFVVMPNDLWYSQSAHSLKATRWTVPPWLWLRISMWRFSHCCNKVAMIVTGREEACLCRILDCWENQITLPSWKDLCCRYCFASRCDMKAPKITSSFCGIGFDCARFRVRRRSAVAGASRTAALIYARMLNTLQLVVGKGSGETLSSR